MTVRTSPGHFLALQNGRRTFAKITGALAEDKYVVLGTMTRSTKYQRKHLDMFKIGADGNVYVQRGKSWDCLTFAGKLGCGMAIGK